MKIIFSALIRLCRRSWANNQILGLKADADRLCRGVTPGRGGSSTALTFSNFAGMPRRRFRQTTCGPPNGPKPQNVRPESLLNDQMNAAGIRLAEPGTCRRKEHLNPPSRRKSPTRRWRPSLIGCRKAVKERKEASSRRRKKNHHLGCRYAAIKRSRTGQFRTGHRHRQIPAFRRGLRRARRRAVREHLLAFSIGENIVFLG